MSEIERTTYRDSDGRAKLTSYGAKAYCSTQATADILCMYEEMLKEKEVEEIPTHVVPRELLLHTWGHGWEESHLIGDDEDPESFVLTECVWINGHIMDENGSDAHADSDHWKENYNRKYGVRVWCGDDEPTKEQREAIQWQG